MFPWKDDETRLEGVTLMNLEYNMSDHISLDQESKENIIQTLLEEEGSLPTELSQENTIKLKSGLTKLTFP